MAQSIDQLIQSLDEQPSLTAYAQTARELPSVAKHLRQIRISLLSTYTIDPIVPFLEVESARHGFSTSVYVAPFNTVRQELLDPNSGCVCHQSEVVFLTHLLGDVCPLLADDFLSLTSEETQTCIDEIVTDLVTCVKTFRQHSKADVVVHNFPIPAHPALGIYEVAAEASQTQAIRDLNRQLATSLTSVPGVYLLDFDHLCSTLGFSQWYDRKAWYLGRAPLAAHALASLARLQAAFLQAIVGTQRKCLVLDLDNTLWGGVVGEDGVSGIKLGDTYPGNVYQDVQRAVLQLHRRGVLLAINSKNNPADVDEVFRTHPGMILKPEHFASTRINWRSKPENMVEIANELNIGADSLVFLDDSPAECELMCKMLPEVLTWQGADRKGRPDPLRSLQIIKDTHVFDRLSFTDDDRQRGVMYRRQAARREFEQSTTSLEQFLTGLDMRMRIGPADEFTLPRVTDLIHRTNQFNLTARRYSAAQIAQFIDDPDSEVFTVRLTDRFGDNGIVGVAIVRSLGRQVLLDTFLLSCRVIGRSVETALLAYLVDWANDQDAVQIEGEFKPTAKNAPAADFYARHGFAPVERNGTESRWCLETRNVPFEWPKYIHFES